MEKLFIATGNAHKITEFKEIFKSLGVEFDIVCPKDFNCQEEPVEDGKTFAENSAIKAKFYYNLFHLPTIADDSGIMIDFFDGKPGIYSARFLPELSYKEKNEYITNQMKNTANRGASFNCVISFVKDGVLKSYEGVVKGTIAYEPDGIEGFGYDPIFISEGQEKTNAVLGDKFKNEHSHRAIALRKWVEDFENK